MRELLLEKDFPEIATDDVLERAGVSRGGMYHHFTSKVELFEAAYEASERDAILRLATIAGEEAARGAGPFDQLVTACLAYVREAASDGELQRIGLRQSRAVLGWERWREAAEPLGIAALRAGIQAAVDAGELESDDITITTHLILAALVEAGLLAATDPNQDRALARIEPEIARLLNGLRAR
jgi:AcrR family transcriptional regulator